MEDWKKEFVPYNLVLRMKALGFDNFPCLAVWYDVPELSDDEYEFFDFHDHFTYAHYETQYYAQKGYKDGVLAPTFSQGFRWFREKCDLWQCIQKYPISENPNRCYYELKGDNINADKDESPNSYMSGWFDSYEEAELACLEKLLEIVESKSE